MVVQRLPEQDDLHRERDRLRAQRARADDAELFADVLDANLMTAQRAFERLPCPWIAQHIFDAQHQKAAVGALQCAGLDQREVRVQRSELRLFFDAAEQVRICGVELDDDRCAVGRLFVDEDVHRVLAQRRFARPGRQRRRRAVFAAGRSGETGAG